MDAKNNPLLMISGLCEGYHWSFDEAMSLTVPQAIMLNHAAWVSRTNSERKYEAKRKKESGESGGVVNSSAEKHIANRVQEMSPEELSQYMSQGWE